MAAAAASSSSAAAAASSSSAAAALLKKHDVFLSFRGVDTRCTFTSHLCAALRGKRIETYIDDRIEIGDEIAPALVEAIEKSKLSVVIFSKNYASSTWCLDELVHILRCEERNGQFVIPIFYDISPSDVRKQQGSCGDAFAQLEERFKDNMDKVLEWRAALTKAANLSGFDYSNKTRTEADLVETVVQNIWTKLIRNSSSDIKGLVGVESRIQQIESLLCIDSPDVYTVGIWGMGGIGKTTLAEAVFHRLSYKFESCCFLANVREKSEKKDGLTHLRNTLLRQIFDDENLNIYTSSIGSDLVKKRLLTTKVLIVLDDVNDSSQLEFLAGSHVQFGPGTRIIVTTRDRRLLRKKVDDDKIYRVEGLNSHEATELFHLNAFESNPCRADYSELSKMVVDYVDGIPLALKILGSSFLHCQKKEDWEEELNKLKKFPSQKIQNVLRLSYDVLEENEKEIFLDIACFYKGMHIDFAKKMLNIHGLFALGIGVLVDKSLISISSMNCLQMHDLLQEMGQAIVHDQCIEEPGKRNRLCIDGDVYHVLKNNTGTATVQGILFNMSEISELHMSPATFVNMYNLRLLMIHNYISSFDKDSKLYLPQGLQSLPDALRYLYWRGYPLKSLPTKFSPENVVELRMPHSQVEQLWNNSQNLGNLKVIDLKFSKHLTEVPNLSKSRKIEHINLYGCTSLVQVPSYFQYLDKLTHLHLGGCSNLNYLSEMPCNIEFLNLRRTAIQELPSSVWSHKKISYLDIRFCKYLKNLPSCRCELKLLGTFYLSGCSSLGKFSELPKGIRSLNLSETAIKVLPSSIECLSGLVDIFLVDCKRLESLPTSICKLKSLKILNLTGCSKFEYFPEILEPMEHLDFLCLEETAVKKLPSSIEYLSGLQQIYLRYCKRLVTLPMSICKLKSLVGLDLHGCSKFKCFPEILEPMEHLKYLYLDGTLVKELPSSIGNLVGLMTLDLRLCKNLKFVPNSIYNLSRFKTLIFDGCSKLKQLPPCSVSLCSLQILSLRYCRGIMEIPDPLICITSLQKLDLKGTMIKSIPASIQQASRLAHVCLNDCKSLQSLPELPMVRYLEAEGCTALRTVSNSTTTVRLGWEEYEILQGFCKKIIFSNCLKLDQNASSNIMADVQLRIMRMTTALSNINDEDGGKYEYFHARSLLYFVCPGKEIPNWFSYQNEGSSIKIKLPSDSLNADFLGFALSVVVASKNYDDVGGLEFGCVSNFKINNGGSREFFFRLYSGGGSNCYNLNSDHVLVWYNAFELAHGTNWPTSINNVTEVSIDFVQLDANGCVNNLGAVKKCGISMFDARHAKNDFMLGGV